LLTLNAVNNGWLKRKIGCDKIAGEFQRMDWLASLLRPVSNSKYHLQFIFKIFI